MPGEAIGAVAPFSPSPNGNAAQAASVRPLISRTRRNHGVMTLGGQMAAIYSSRRTAACYGVRFEIGAGTLSLASDMTPAQARALARALTSAADAVEGAAKGGAQ